MEGTDWDRERQKARAWATVRIFLGQAQVIGAAASFYLLLAEGVTARTLGFAAFTCVCTLTSVLLFWRRDRKF